MVWTEGSFENGQGFVVVIFRKSDAPQFRFQRSDVVQQGGDFGVVPAQDDLFDFQGPYKAGGSCFGVAPFLLSECKVVQLDGDLIMVGSIKGLPHLKGRPELVLGLVEAALAAGTMTLATTRLHSPGTSSSYSNCLRLHMQALLTRRRRWPWQRSIP